MNRYLVPPGKKLRLKDYSPDDKSLFSGTKEESLIEFDKLREELQELQKKKTLPSTSTKFWLFFRLWMQGARTAASSMSSPGWIRRGCT